jgi:hypothetical protein
MKTFDLKELYRRFEYEVANKIKDIDVDDMLDLYSLSLGWALANTLIINDAQEFAIYARDIKHFV